MQCTLKYNTQDQMWSVTNGKNPKCQHIFEQIINGLYLYNGNVPPFMTQPITHTQWVQIKSETNTWNDVYIDIPSDTIRQLYATKGCEYIQISNGFGLYHLGNDICNFNVPIFDTKQQLRVRIKIHTRSNKQGFCNLSVTVACQPINIKNLKPSRYSLDDKDNLPPNLNYT